MNIKPSSLFTNLFSHLDPFPTEEEISHGPTVETAAANWLKFGPTIRASASISTLAGQKKALCEIAFQRDMPKSERDSLMQNYGCSGAERELRFVRRRRSERKYKRTGGPNLSRVAKFAPLSAGRLDTSTTTTHPIAIPDDSTSHCNPWHMRLPKLITLSVSSSESVSPQLERAIPCAAKRFMKYHRSGQFSQIDARNYLTTAAAAVDQWRKGPAPSVAGLGSISINTCVKCVGFVFVFLIKILLLMIQLLITMCCVHCWINNIINLYYYY